MGEAKRRAIQPPADPEIIRRVAVAVRKLATAASGGIGSDCWTHAAIGHELLKHAGIESAVVSGETAWRVGDGDGDVILHGLFGSHVDMAMVMAGKAAGNFHYHTWLEVGTRILDLTTYQLHEKAKQLDAQDGGRTTVDWCPDYLFVDKKSSSSINDVRRHSAGMYYYRRDPVIEAILKRGSEPVDQEDLAAAMIIYNNPDIIVSGPNSRMRH